MLAAQSAAAMQRETRPDIPESVVTMPRGVVQLEMGSSYGRESQRRTVSTGEPLLRAGVSARVELQLAPSAVMIEVAPQGRVLGLHDSFVGLKAMLRPLAPRPAPLPGVSLALGGSLPTGHPRLSSRRMLPRATLMTAWMLSPRVELSVDAGWARESAGRAAVDTWTGVLSVGMSLSPRTSLYSEYVCAGTEAGSRAGPALLTAGASYLLAPTIQLDLRIGARTDAPGAPSFYHLGFARTF